MTGSGEGSERARLTQRAAEEYRNLWIDGARPDPEEFCATHPECGDALRPAIERFLFVADGLDALASEGGVGGGIQPEELGDFRLVREIGRGGMGVVYEAEQRSLRRTVALKVLPAHVTLQPTAVERFRREASTAARLRHEGIVAVHSVGEHGDAHFFAMSFVEGAPLDEVVAELRCGRPAAVTGARLRAIVERFAHRPSKTREADDEPVGGGHPEVWEEPHCRAMARLVVQVADALEYSHRAGVVHRDVKPSNILVRPNGTAVLTDFGLAREEGLPSLTMTGQFAGTPHYVSPEQAEAGRGGTDARSDVYALGATLYELLTLEHAFDGRTGREVLGRILSAQDPVRPRRLDRRIPRDLETICLTAIEKDPARRYQCAGDMAEDLHRFLDDRPVRARPVGPVGRGVRVVRRKPLRAAAAAIFLLLLGVFLVSKYRDLREVRREKAAALEQKALLESALAFMTTGFGFSTANPSGTLEANAARMAPVTRGWTLSARALAEQAVRSITLMTDEGSDARALLCRTMGSVCRLLGMYGEARRLLEAALDHCEAAPHPDALAMADCLHRLGVLEHDLMVQEGNDPEEIKLRFVAAGERYDAALARLRSSADETGGAPTPAVLRAEASVLSDQGTLHLDRYGRLKVRARRLREDPAAFAVLLPEIEVEAETAERLLDEARDLRTSLGEDEAEARAETIHQLALLHYERGRFALEVLRRTSDEVVPFFRDARDFVQQALDLTPRTYQDILGRPHRRPDWRARNLLLQIAESHLDDVGLPPREGLDALVRAGVPPLFCVAVASPSPERTNDAEEGMFRARIVRIDPRVPGRHELVFEAPPSVEAPQLELAPSISRHRLCFVQRDTAGRSTSINVLDTVGHAPPLRLADLPWSQVNQPCWHPTGERIYFSGRPLPPAAPAVIGDGHMEWETLDRGKGVFWLSADGGDGQAPREFLHLTNQEFQSVAFSPVAPHDEICFLHYPWNHGDSARNLWLAGVNREGTQATWGREILTDNLGDSWCAFSADGTGLYLQQAVNTNKFEGADRNVVVLLRVAGDAIVDERILRVGSHLARPSVSATGLCVTATREGGVNRLLVFDAAWSEVGAIEARDLGLEGWVLSSPTFVR